jgi:endonuclease/exonuclease/phosphatase family metal-dependent hydrolase
MNKNAEHGIQKPNEISRRQALNGVLACALGLAVFASGCSSVAEQKPTTLRVMSYNIHHGEGLDKRVDLERIAAVIKAEKADIVGLQEVDKGVERTARRDMPAELAALTGMTCVFSNNFHHQGGKYGNAVLTRFPVKSWSNRHYKMLRPGEQRGIIQVLMEVEGRPLMFMNTHIDYRGDDSERWENTKEIKELVDAYSDVPTIIVGDFNDYSHSRVYKRLTEFLVDAWTVAGEGDGFTIPANKPNRRIDYIFYTPASPIVPKRVWVPVTEASDHRPVVAELEFGVGKKR